MIALFNQKHSKNVRPRMQCRECGKDLSKKELENGLCFTCTVKLNNDIRILDDDTNEFNLE